jgi:hypothetical protein
VLAAVLMFGSALAWWSLDSNEDSRGIFTLTDIPAEYHGMYALLYGIYDDDESFVIGAKEVGETIDDLKLVAITDGSVDFPLWFVTEGDRLIVDRYAGSETLNVGILIFDDEPVIIPDDPQPLAWAYFDAVGFIENHATRSWNDADVSSE